MSETLQPGERLSAWLRAGDTAGKWLFCVDDPAGKIVFLVYRDSEDRQWKVFGIDFAGLYGALDSSARHEAMMRRHLEMKLRRQAKGESTPRAEECVESAMLWCVRVGICDAATPTRSEILSVIRDALSRWPLTEHCSSIQSEVLSDSGLQTTQR